MSRMSATVTTVRKSMGDPAGTAAPVELRPSCAAYAAYAGALLRHGPDESSVGRPLPAMVDREPV